MDHKVSSSSSPETARNENDSTEKKMHQTSTRIMRTNPDGRPFANVCQYVFAWLTVGLFRPIRYVDGELEPEDSSSAIQDLYVYFHHGGSGP